MGFEPMTSSLPRKCSTPELRRLMFLFFDFGFGKFDLGSYSISHHTPILIFYSFKPEIENRHPT
jgi:hypothetical protein